MERTDMLTNIHDGNADSGGTPTGNLLLDTGKRDLSWLARAHGGVSSAEIGVPAGCEGVGFGLSM